MALGARLPRFLLGIFRLLGDGITGGGEEGRLVLVEGGVGVVVVGGEGGLEHGEGVSQGDTGSLSKHSHPTVALLVGDGGGVVGGVVEVVDVDGGDGNGGPLCGVTCCVLRCSTVPPIRG